MRHQIYTVKFMQGINRTSNVKNCIVVACDKFMGAYNHLPVFGIFNYVHWWGQELYYGIAPQAKAGPK